MHILILRLREYPWYYETYTYVTETRVPLGTIELIQRQDLSDTGIPVGTTGLIQIQDLSDTGVPVGTTGLIQIQAYP